ncbi:hypothetical protein [Ovoidimarina sediminis]|uniref:hypothetical protein n=1 Tax=Ovoidimarina sediminis TaxID=3079856 RepID=UPI00290F5696|nr:hypothetical protein [Rhodophyticola sp. MJ-SS7]MDU8946158.1 hypothetical protein [Rhodophyticola sp. MJ-SS7]
MVASLPPYDGEIVSSWKNPDGSPWGRSLRAEHGYCIEVSGLCDFRFGSLGESLTCNLLEGRARGDADHVFSATIQPLIESLHGTCVFHAGCVQVGDGAVVFMGESGRGKSTLVTDFAMHGGRFLTDDVLVVTQDGKPTAHPHDATVRLWSDSIEGVGAQGAHIETYASYTRKRRLRAGAGFRQAKRPTPIRAAFILGDRECEDVSIRDLGGIASHKAWIRHLFVLDLERKEAFMKLFEGTAEIAANVPTFQLEYPRDYAALPRLRHAILSAVEDERLVH